MLPRKNKILSRGKVILLAALALALFFFSGSLLHRSGHLKVPMRATFRYFYAPAKRRVIEHPIPDLMKEAETKFNTMLTSQSQSLSEAVKTYKSRYGRKPPRGFDEWYNFAVENGVAIIDEYDQLHEDMQPFWLLSGKEIRRRCTQVAFLPSVDLVRVQDGKARTVDASTGFDDLEVGARAKGFKVMLEKFQAKLPNMDFPINEKAEGRILVPWEQNRFANLTADSSRGLSSVIGGEYSPDWRSDGGSVWEAFRRTCHPTCQARRLFSSVRTPLKQSQAQAVNLLAAAGVAPPTMDEDFNFATAVDDKFDFCQHPWAHYDQGHFFSDSRTLPALYPMFSPAKAGGYSDILIPSHYYYSSTKRYTYGWDATNKRINNVDDMEVPWEKKSNKIFWRGATTGGGSSPPGFLSRYQRHRLIRMASDSSDNNRTVVFADPPASDKYVEGTLPVKHLNERMMDVAFVKAVGCTQYPGGCDGLHRDHRFADQVLLGENWRHKYLIDIDGMGYSARFFALLMSESAVMKATVYREFFSDWIQPWLHYIPISQNYQEIYNTHAYFSGPSRDMSKSVNGTLPHGHHDDSELRKIAMEGRKWKMTHGRKIDMEVYVYRLALEWGRLSSDDREAMTYQG